MVIINIECRKIWPAQRQSRLLMRTLTSPSRVMRLCVIGVRVNYHPVHHEHGGGLALELAPGCGVAALHTLLQRQEGTFPVSILMTSFEVY